MKFENLDKLAKLVDDDQYGYSVIDHNPHLFCDARIMCVAGEMELRSDKWKEKVKEFWEKVKSADSGMVLGDGGLFGNFDVAGYVRRLDSESGPIFVQERYRRVFSDDSEFRGLALDKPVTVYENGALVGIIMPIKVDDPESWPPVPYLGDEIVYHRCICDECGEPA